MSAPFPFGLATVDVIDTKTGKPFGLQLMRWAHNGQIYASANELKEKDVTLPWALPLAPGVLHTEGGDYLILWVTLPAHIKFGQELSTIIGQPDNYKTYFVLSRRMGMVKIGKAIDIADRLKSLQTASADTLELLASLPNNQETAMHQRFAHLRERGEWFTYSREIEDFIKSLAA